MQLGGRSPGLGSQTVVFDPTHDIAVLRVPGLRAAPLTLVSEAASGASGAVLGYPENGPYYVSGPFRSVGNDHYRLDADHDGIACER